MKNKLFACALILMVFIFVFFMGTSTVNADVGDINTNNKISGNVTFENMNGTPIKNFNSDTQICAKYFVQNNGYAESCNLYMALYDKNGKLLNLLCKTITANAYTTANDSLTMNISRYQKSDKIACFIWSDSVEPLTNPEVLYRSGTYDESDILIPILLYHHIAERNEDFNEYIISSNAFRKHMDTLKSAGYNCVTFDDYYSYINGIGKLPEKPIIITFDDGYYSNYQYAYPTLKELGMNATIFIVTDTVGERDRVTYPHFTWEQAREMEESGIISIQSHSHSHFSLPGMNEETMVKEFSLSKYLIEANLNKECRYFAYPNGAFNAKSQSLAEKEGYKMQSTTIPGYNTKSTPPQTLRRFMVRSDLSSNELLAMLSAF